MDMNNKHREGERVGKRRGRKRIGKFDTPLTCSHSLETVRMWSGYGTESIGTPNGYGRLFITPKLQI